MSGIASGASPAQQRQHRLPLGSGNGGDQPGQAGGSGLLVVAYEIAEPPASEFNNATGGVVDEVPDWNGSGQTWRIHTFTANETFRVLQGDFPFRVLAVGGGFYGGIGDSDQYGGGGGGVTDQTSVTFNRGDHPVVVGGANGGQSSVNSVVANGAAGGNGVPGAGGGGGGSNGQNGGNGTQTNITGTPTYYGGGGGSVDWNYCCPSRGGCGGLGGGGDSDPCSGCGNQNAKYYGGGGGRVQHTCGGGHGGGYQGIVRIAYQIG